MIQFIPFSPKTHKNQTYPSKLNSIFPSPTSKVCLNMEKRAKNSNISVQTTLIPFPNSQIQRYGNILYITLKEKHLKQLKHLSKHGIVMESNHFKQHESLF